LTLLDGNVEVVFADLPQAPPGATSRFFLTRMVAVAVAELEAGLVSVRTKAALAAAKRKATKLDNPPLAKASVSGVTSIKRNADAFARQVLPMIRDIQQKRRSIPQSNRQGARGPRRSNGARARSPHGELQLRNKC
jgi:DNA invertase Pin-like site-specific DNA recombinase